MSSVITNEQVKKMLADGKKGDQVGGLMLCRSYNVQLTKTNKEYIVGVLQSGTELPFKAWGDSRAFTELKNADYSNIPCRIGGSLDTFGGQVSVVLDTIVAVNDIGIDAFLPVIYDADVYCNALQSLFKSCVSQQCYEIADTVLFSNAPVLESFKKEFAAVSHHDNCLSGLLAHTYKVLVNVVNTVKTYPNIAPNQNTKDLLLLGALLHDIGKTREMNIGVYQPCSVVTHRYLGIEFLDAVKTKLIEFYGVQWYYELISIFLQHHGEFDDDCRSVASYVVHQADLFESRLADLNQKLENPIESTAGKKVKVENKFLLI